MGPHKAATTTTNDPIGTRGSATIIATQREAMGARAGRGKPDALRAADWLSLAAAPTFAIMALLTILGGDVPDMLCSGAHGASPLSGMGLMYVLMSAFHSAPWLKLISSGVARAGGHAARRAAPSSPYRMREQPAPWESRHTCHSHRSIPGI
jgi:hypothetical protein